MPRFVVCRPYHKPTSEETYATRLTLPARSEVQYLAEEVALWPEGTVVQWWTVDASDAGAARLQPTFHAIQGPELLTLEDS